MSFTLLLVIGLNKSIELTLSFGPSTSWFDDALSESQKFQLKGKFDCNFSEGPISVRKPAAPRRAIQVPQGKIKAHSCSGIYLHRTLKTPSTAACSSSPHRAKILIHYFFSIPNLAPSIPK